MRDHGITVLGAGSWGTALAIRLATNHNDTCLWGHEADFMATLSRERLNQQFLPGFRFPEKLTLEKERSADLSERLKKQETSLSETETKLYIKGI